MLNESKNPLSGWLADQRKQQELALQNPPSFDLLTKLVNAALNTEPLSLAFKLAIGVPLSIFKTKMQFFGNGDLVQPLTPEEIKKLVEYQKILNAPLNKPLESEEIQELATNATRLATRALMHHL